MKLTKEKAKENLSKLIVKFRGELESGRAQDYNEEATKKSFIEPLLQDVLGWDVRDNDEVSPEERVSKGRVDYGLKIEGVAKIYIEAKPIRADLDKHIDQAIRYGYNKKGVPFVLLTDFEGIKLFDVTVKPDSRNFLKGLNIDLHWEEYLKQFDKIWLLSKNSVIEGELDKLLLVKPKNRLPVDKAILDDLKRWRIYLAKDIFKNNHDLFNSGDREKDAHFLKEITQRLLDRIIFMRSCEDRNLTYRPKLKEIFEERTESVGTNTIIFLKEEFKHYNIIFDSDLFRPKEWEDNLAINFKVMRDIIFETYNPYQFDVIPLEVLGNIYEQYLGYTVRLTDHQVKYELKPEVRKAGGVYYTPEYIVDYIVKNTVGKLIQELSDRKIKKLRILDPACGSGSFLIRAYEEMLKYYRSQKKGKKKSKNKMSKLEFDYEETETHLTIEDKGEILRRHIFGVDLDEQAVEVTKLSLMLKMLEDEYGLIHGRSILPILDRNIRCGNSLISGDVLELKNYFGDNWYTVKSFNWEDVFQKIMVDEGGFDVVLGNPPYILIQNLFRDDEQLTYFREKYFSAAYKIDTYHLFFEKGLLLLNNNGYLGYITPSNYLTNNGLVNLRKFILERNYIDRINIINGKVFQGVSVDTSISIFCNKKNSECLFVQSDWINGELLEKAHKKVKRDSLLKDKYHLFLPSEKYNPSVAYFYLGDMFSVKFGMQLRDRKKFTSDVIKRDELDKITEYHKECYTGKDINRYWLAYSDLLAYANKEEAKRGGCWDFSIHSIKTKILVRQIGKYPICALDTEGRFCLNTLFMIVPKDQNSKFNIRYILGILNSKMIRRFWGTNFYDLRSTFPKIKGTYLKKIPIPKIDFSDHSEKDIHDDIVRLVNEMLNLNKKIQTAKGNERQQIQRQIEKIDREIDELVYKLYDLTEEEIRIVEGFNKG